MGAVLAVALVVVLTAVLSCPAVDPGLVEKERAKLAEDSASLRKMSRSWLDHAERNIWDEVPSVSDVEAASMVVASHLILSIERTRTDIIARALDSRNPAELSRAFNRAYTAVSHDLAELAKLSSKIEASSFRDDLLILENVLMREPGNKS